jgi:hypothetical protein
MGLGNYKNSDTYNKVRDDVLVGGALVVDV